jgi:nicotinate-nucleotide adenylyltransferase
VVSPRRVALYGGSFDPPHNGHVLLATWVLSRANPPVDALWLLPAAGHAFGKPLTPFETRVAMLERAFSHLGPRVRVEPIEQTLPTPSYTVDTVRALLTQHPHTEFSLIMGSDAYASRERWKEWTTLESLLGGRILVIGREGSPSDGPPPAITLPDFSSTAVRKAVHDQSPYWWMVPEAVQHLIESEGLYR